MLLLPCGTAVIFNDDLGGSTDGGGMCRDIFCDDARYADDCVIAHRHMTDHFRAISEKHMPTDLGPLLGAMRQHQPHIGIEVAIRTDADIRRDDDAHRVRQPQTWPDLRVAADFNLEKPEQDLCRKNRRQPVARTPKLKAHQRHRVDAVQGQTQREPLEKTARRVILEITPDVCF